MFHSLRRVLIVFSVLTLIILPSSGVVAAADNGQGKGPPILDRVVFVHYPKDLPAKGGLPGKPPTDGGDATKEWYKYSGIHWNISDIPVTYKVNILNYSTDFLDGIQAAFQEWEADSQSSIDFEYYGDFTGFPSSFQSGGTTNGTNEVGWVDISNQYPNAIAVTMIWYNSLTKEITEVDMAMNSYLPWAQSVISGDPDQASGVTGHYDVQNIATHEVGHWLMLGDLYNKPTMTQTMYGYGSLGEVSKRSLESGDLAGLRAIYP
ncbi:hypothetical protein DEALK_11610 [Dehalogenimonas alkenigignens]|uniref:Peptidase M10 metallopeptidase domain-containing protein n=1 Tax=Dehalogenimonas alkenigignens TaxID=1217799 RepID=A0A0W0GIB7_9CHLR|nr:hypothetical protein [Dehalogenimonas alkenigignens]KTB48315.1 hypothetical protein DEALK_11610 [Dehalogenimonas alkenigignens]